MIFYFLRFFVQIALKFYFRTIYFLNEEAIPDGQPIILAGNHSNSALDAIIIDAFLRKNKLYWLARGDTFNSKFTAKIMTIARTAPIYRASEVGFVDIKRNAESFKYCFDLLRKNLMVGIFPEGITVHERRLQTPFKKGFARLAFQAHEVLNRPIMIIPVGVSYHSLTKLRTDTFVKFGEAFSTEKYIGEYKINPNNALKQITLELERRLNNQVINYDTVVNQPSLNKEIEFNINQYLSDKSRIFGVSTDPTVYNLEKQIVDKYIEKEGKEIVAIHENVLFYHNENPSPKSTLSTIWFKTVVLIASLLYFVPNQISKYIVSSKIKKSAFFGTVTFLLLYFIFPIYLVVLGFLGSLFTRFSFLISLLIIPAIVYLGLKCKNLLDPK